MEVLNSKLENTSEVGHENREISESRKNLELDNIKKCLSEVKKFLDSDYLKQTRKREFGIKLPEQREMMGKYLPLFEEKIKGIEKDENFEIVTKTHLGDVLGNGVVILPRMVADKFDNRKEISLEKAGKIKENADMLFYYLRELASNDNILSSELASPIGYLGDYANYFCRDIPTQALNQLKFFKFFRELEKGMSRQEFESQVEELKKDTIRIRDENRNLYEYLEAEKVKKDLKENENGDLILERYE